jgi:hypothetical protein
MQEARGLHSVSFFFEKAHVTRKTSSRQTTSRLHVERTQNKLDSSGMARETRRFSSSTMKCLGLVDVGPTGFSNDMTTSHGPWPSPQTKARRGATSASPNPSRIGQTSQIPMKSNF